MQRYAITDRRVYGTTEHERRLGLLREVEGWARGGVEWVQVREKDLNPGDLSWLLGEVVELVARTGASTRVMVNGLPTLAHAMGASGVHLGRGDLSALPERVRRAQATLAASAAVSVACHSVEEARVARDAGASLLVFAPVFEKPIGPNGEALAGSGLAALREACAAANPVPVFALGGVTAENAHACMAVGAAGVAGIRLFSSGGWRGLSQPAG